MEVQIFAVTSVGFPTVGAFGGLFPKRGNTERVAQGKVKPTGPKAVSDPAATARPPPPRMERTARSSGATARLRAELRPGPPSLPLSGHCVVDALTVNQ